MYIKFFNPVLICIKTFIEIKKYCYVHWLDLKMIWNVVLFQTFLGNLWYTESQLLAILFRQTWTWPYRLKVLNSLLDCGSTSLILLCSLQAFLKAFDLEESTVGPSDVYHNKGENLHTLVGIYVVDELKASTKPNFYYQYLLVSGNHF